MKFRDEGGGRNISDRLAMAKQSIPVISDVFATLIQELGVKSFGPHITLQRIPDAVTHVVAGPVPKSFEGGLHGWS